MNIRFSPFRPSSRSDTRQIPTEPVPPVLVTTDLDIVKPRRKVTIVHPEPRDAYQLKARLMADGHRTIETFFLPESFLSVYRDGHRPHVVFIHDFAAEHAGMSGVELARQLRLEHKFAGLLFSSSETHRGMSTEALGVHGFSGHIDHYFRNGSRRSRPD